jgi:pimeloyl-ACP methyl ester carboxylesterase
MAFQLHLLNSRKNLSEIETVLREAIFEAEAKLASLGKQLDVDIIASAADFPLFENIHILGSSLSPSRIDLAIAMAKPFDGGSFRAELMRTLYHELHHVIRWDGPGYGKTLGEALVSEGLAQLFVHAVMVCPPEPWEMALTPGQLSLFSVEAYHRFDDCYYSHEEWFFGGGELPLWAGYSLGAKLVARYMSVRPGVTALALADEPASGFRDDLMKFSLRG